MNRSSAVAIDMAAIHELVVGERRARDSGQWSHMHRAFAPDSEVRISWMRGSGREFVEASRRMSERGSTATHRLSPPVIRLIGRRALVETSMVIQLHGRLDGIPVHLESWARMWQCIERSSARWTIRSLDCIYERDVLTADDPAEPLIVDPREVARHRSSYSNLAYFMSRNGYDVPDDLYGTDRPGGVIDLYHAGELWLELNTESPSE